jgi:hypothetical protein
VLLLLDRPRLRRRSSPTARAVMPVAAVQAAMSLAPVSARSLPVPPAGLAAAEADAEADVEADAEAEAVGLAVADAWVALSRVNSSVPKPSWS